MLSLSARTVCCKKWRVNSGMSWQPGRAVPSFSRRAFTSNSKPPISENGTNTTTETVTSQDLQNVLQEVKALQALIKEQKLQSYQMESLTRSVGAQSAQLESRLQEIENHVKKISAIETAIKSVREFLHTNPAVKGLVENVETIVQRSAPIVKNYKNFILGTLIAGGIAWQYRGYLFYDRTSEEVADLARRTLEQESLHLSIQKTLRTVASSPSTLHTLNDLLQKLVTEERTKQDLVNLVQEATKTPQVQKALLDLLQMVFEDPNLQQLAGEFLLKGLDIDHVKAMLDAQTQDLVRETVKDDSVQQATAVGIKRSLWYVVIPPFLWRFMEQDKKKHIPKDKKVKKEKAERGSSGNNGDDDAVRKQSKDSDNQASNDNLPSQ